MTAVVQVGGQPTGEAKANVLICRCGRTGERA